MLRADSLSCKSCYQLILFLNPETRHCVHNFRFDFVNLDWTATWKALFFMLLDRKVIDLWWKIALGVLYTAHRLVLFGRLDIPLACFCGHPVETLEYLFLHCPLAQSGQVQIQSFLFLSSPLAPSISFVTFFLVSTMMSCVFRAFSAISCLFSNFMSGIKGKTIISSLSLLVLLGSLSVLKAVSLFTYRCSSNASNPGAGVFFSVNGVPMDTLVKSLVTSFVFLFNFYCVKLLLLFVVFCPSFLLPPTAFVDCSVVSSSFLL